MTDGFFGMIDPQALAEKMRQGREHQMMHQQIDAHAIQKFINEQDEEGLKTLSLIILQCQSKRNISYLIGRIDARAEYKFKKCPCGTEHEDLDDVLKEDPAAEADRRHYAGEDEPAMATDKFVETLVEMNKDESLEELGRLREMKKYGIEPHPDFGMEEWEEKYEVRPAPFRCSNCGQNYQSLEDRMLRPPGIDGCSGCKIKSAHG